MCIGRSKPPEKWSAAAAGTFVWRTRLKRRVWYPAGSISFWESEYFVEVSNVALEAAIGRRSGPASCVSGTDVAET